MSINFPASLRRVKPHRVTSQLTPRDPNALVAADRAVASRVVLDTTVYVDRAAGRLSDSARAVIDGAALLHCSACLAEFALGLGNLNPRDARWAAVRSYQVDFFSNVLDTRVLTPDADVWIEAGLVAGLLARTQHFKSYQRKECLNDALIYLTAAKAGLPVLTANRDDFDLIQQIAGRGAFIWY